MRAKYIDTTRRSINIIKDGEIIGHVQIDHYGKPNERVMVAVDDTKGYELKGD